MYKTYQRINSRMRIILWWIVAIGLIAALPLTFARWQTEQTSDTVEIVFDYRKLLEIADKQPNPQAFTDEHLDRMREAGVTTLSVYESTLEELRLSRDIRFFTEKDAALFTGNLTDPTHNFTYVLFKDDNTDTQLRPIIERGFARMDIGFHPWNASGLSGLVIETPNELAKLIPLDPNPATMSRIQEKGFAIAARLSDIPPYDMDELDRLLGELKQYGTTNIIFAGKAVTGFKDNAKLNSIAATAELLNKHGIGFATIETVNAAQQQKGIGKLAYHTNYNVERLHSLNEREAAQDPSVLADRFVLAATDRNIRMLYLNATTTENRDEAKLQDPLSTLYQALSGDNGAISRIEKEGMNIGPASPFEEVHYVWEKPLKAVVLLGGVALIALALSYFVPILTLGLFVIGLAGTAGLYVVSSTLLLKAMALGVGIFASTLAVILAIRSIRQRQRGVGRQKADRNEAGQTTNREKGSVPATQNEVGSNLLFAGRLLLVSSAVSLVGAAYIVGLLNNVTFFLYLDQFRGVSVLHLIPILLIAWYVFITDRAETAKDTIEKVRGLLYARINVLAVIAIGVLAIGVQYYLTRTGNQGQVSAYEKMFRSMLENTLGVRPRTKEFMFAHPLFLVGAYYIFRYKNAVFLFIAGVVGQLSIVDTFAHLHTPFLISLIRVVNGLVLGVIIGVIAIVVLEAIRKGWNKWAPSLKL